MSEKRVSRFGATVFYDPNSPAAPGVVVPGNIVDAATDIAAHAGMSEREKKALVAWIVAEALKDPWSKSLPPLTILNLQGLIEEFWGWDRLFPFDFEDFSELPMYKAYLENFYSVNGEAPDESSPDRQCKIAVAACKCLKKEKIFVSWLKSQRASVIPLDLELSVRIQKCMLGFVDNTRDDVSACTLVVPCAAACIAMEAELMTELLKQGAHVPHHEYALSREIRKFALELVKEGHSSVHAAATLMGIAKEAKWLRDNARLLPDPASAKNSRTIRLHALDFLMLVYDESDSDDMPSPEGSDDGF
ncbi:hypothetical protein ACP70R_032403 [Stipagrostis hirtigluma subsp. patula]